MYLAIHGFLNLFNFRIGTGCPSKVADLLRNSLISGAEILSQHGSSINAATPRGKAATPPCTTIAKQVPKPLGVRFSGDRYEFTRHFLFAVGTAANRETCHFRVVFLMFGVMEQQIV
jgi:hypothetical protein